MSASAYVTAGVVGTGIASTYASYYAYVAVDHLLEVVAVVPVHPAVVITPREPTIPALAACTAIMSFTKQLKHPILVYHTNVFINSWHVGMV